MQHLCERLKLNSDSKIANDLYSKFVNLRENKRIYLYSQYNGYESMVCKEAPKFNANYKYYTLHGNNDVFMKHWNSIRCLKEIFDNNEKYILVNVLDSNQSGRAFLLLFFNKHDAELFERQDQGFQIDTYDKLTEKYFQAYQEINEYLDV